MPKNLREILENYRDKVTSMKYFFNPEIIDQAITEIKGLVGDTKEDTLRNMGVEE